MHVSSAPPILEGRQPSLLRMYCRTIRCLLEAYFSLFSATFQIPCQVHHCLPSTATIPVWYRALCCHLRNLSTTLFCDPLTCASTSTSPFHFRSFSLHQQWPDQDHQWAHLMPQLLPLHSLPPLYYHHIQDTQDSCHHPLLLHSLPLEPLFLCAWSNNYSRT